MRLMRGSEGSERVSENTLAVMVVSSWSPFSRERERESEGNKSHRLRDEEDEDGTLEM